ncbi:hypothetical protein [Kitasatospora sp. NPDC088783]|uniref:hypothetical protein n=1 Tax=Kitasatospora sp. NPDC088783 TaxID=3364077 RepID=UPI003817F9A2
MPVRAEVLLTTAYGHVVVTGTGPHTALPGGPVPPGEPPTQAAQLVLDKIGLGTAVGRLLFSDWPDPAPPPGTVPPQVCVYGHRPLTDAETATLTGAAAATGPRLVDPAGLDPAAPATRRILTALDAQAAHSAPTLVPAPRAGCSVLAQLLLSCPDGRIVISPAGAHPQYGLPGAEPGPSEAPHAAAARAGQSVTGLARLDPGRLLATDWRAGADGLVLVHIYDHPVLTGGQAAALAADAGNPRIPLPLRPGDAARTLHGAAIGAALAARIEGRTAELVDGVPRHPGVLDRYLLHLRERPAPRRTQWQHGEPEPGAGVRGARMWLLASDGRVVVHHHPETGATELPSRQLHGETPVETGARTMAGLVLDTAPYVIGHHHGDGFDDVRLVGPVQAVGPLPAESGIVRLLMTPHQAAELVHHPIDPGETETVRRAAAALSLPPDPARQPVTEIHPVPLPR